MTKRFTKQDLIITQDETLYQGFMQLHRLTFNHQTYAGGQQNSVQREIFYRDKAVGILLYDPNLQEFIFVEQVRIGALGDPVSPWLTEIVAGMVEKGESDEGVAIREAQEEAGAKVKKMIPIVDYWVSPGGTNEKVGLFLGLVDADQVGDYGGLASESEDIKVIRISKAETLKMLQSGLINNAMSIISLQWFFLNEAQIDFAD